MRTLYWVGLALLLTQAACSSDSKPEATTAREPGATPPTSRPHLRRTLRQLLPAAQEFTIRPNRDTVLRGGQGTEIQFRAGSLALPKGSGPVTLTLREFYTPADIVLAGLGTRAGRRLLETGGMLQVEARAAGRPVKLRADATLQVRLPTQRLKPGMELFEGQPDTSGQVTWKLAPPRPVRQKPVTDLILFDESLGEDAQSEYPGDEAARPNQRGSVPAGAAAARPSKPRQRTGERAAGAGTSSGDALTDAVYYEFELAKLGWINCDRFLDSKQPLIDVLAPADPADAAIYLVFNSTRSVLMADTDSLDRACFFQVPQGAPVTIVALRQVGEQLQLATRAVKLRPDLSSTTLKFRPVTPAQLRAALLQLK